MFQRREGLLGLDGGTHSHYSGESFGICPQETWKTVQDVKVLLYNYQLLMYLRLEKTGPTQKFCAIELCEVKVRTS